MMISGANNEQLPINEPQTRSTRSMQVDNAVSIVEESSEEEQLVVMEEHEMTAPSVIAAVVTPDSKTVPVVMDSSNVIVSDSSYSPTTIKSSSTTTTAPENTLVRSDSEKVLKSNLEKLLKSPKPMTGGAKATFSASLSAAGSSPGKNAVTKFDLLRGKYEAGCASPRSPAVIKKKIASPSPSPKRTSYEAGCASPRSPAVIKTNIASPSPSPKRTSYEAGCASPRSPAVIKKKIASPSPSPKRTSPIRQKSPPRTGNNNNNNSNSHIVSAPPLAPPPAVVTASSSPGTPASAATAASHDNNNNSNAQQTTQQQQHLLLEAEIARIKAELQRKKLQQEKSSPGSTTVTSAAAAAAASTSDDSNTINAPQTPEQQQFLLDEIARILELEREKLHQNILIKDAATAAETQHVDEAAANSAPAWTTSVSSAAAAPTTTTTTRLESHLDKGPAANTLAAATAAISSKNKDNPYTYERMIVDLDDSVSMSSSRSLLSTPGKDRARLLTTTTTAAAAAAAFSAPPPLSNDEKTPSAAAAASLSPLDKNKFAAAAAKMQQQQPHHPTTGGGSSRKHPTRQGSANNKRRPPQHGSNRSLRSGNSSSNRSIQSIPENELIGASNNNAPLSPRATVGSALSCSSTSPSAAANKNRRRPSAGNSRSSSGRNLQQQQQQRISTPAVASMTSSNKKGAPRRAHGVPAAAATHEDSADWKNELDTRKMELSKKREDLTQRILDLNNCSKDIFREPAAAGDDHPTVLVSMPNRSRGGGGGGVDGSKIALAEEGQIKKNGTESPDDDFVGIPDDVYNMFFLSNVGGQAFVYALYVFLLKIALFTFLGIDAVQVPMPENVETKVKVTQFLMLPVAVAMQDDLITTIYLISNVKYWPGVTEKSPDASRLKWKLATLFRGIDGIFSLFINFIVLLKAEQVLSLFLNFAALQFLQNIDNMAVRLASDGYLTERLEQVAQNVKECKLPRLHSEFLRTLDSLLFFFIFAILLVAWSVISFA